MKRKKKNKLFWNVKIYFKLILQQLKAILEYQSDFYITLVAAILTQVLGFIFIWVIYNNIPDINGWQFWEVVFIYAMIFFTEGICSAFFDGIWKIGLLANQGEFDRFLIRPVSPLVQILGSNVGMNGYGNIITGVFLIVQAFVKMNFHWTLYKVFILVILLFSTVIIRLSIYLIANSISFWVTASNNSTPYMVHSLCDFAKYPITIFPRFIQVVISVAIPYAFVSYFPAAYLFNKEMRMVGLLTPFVAICFCILAVSVFYKGVNIYDSSGN